MTILLNRLKLSMVSCSEDILFLLSKKFDKGRKESISRELITYISLRYYILQLRLKKHKQPMHTHRMTQILSSPIALAFFLYPNNPFYSTNFISLSNNCYREKNHKNCHQMWHRWVYSFRQRLGQLLKPEELG